MTAVSLFEEGLLSEDDAVWFARELVTSGLVNSTGTYQRFVASVIDEVSPENFYMDGELFA
jgi:phenylpyruvate tautomerase PptA (4-oxalocrotonate tautomerase family)